MRYTVKTVSFYFVMAMFTAGLFANDGVKKERLPDHKKAELEPAGHDIVPGFVETKPINDVIHSVVPREQQLAGKAPINRVQRNTNYGEPRKDYTKVELEKLLERAKTNKRSLSQEELIAIEAYIQSQEQKKSIMSVNNYNRFNSYSRTQILSDDFSYSDGSLVGNGSWAHYSGTTTGQIQVSSGTVLINDSDSEDARVEFTSVTSGTVYFGMDVQLADPGSYTGTDFEYVFGFADSANTYSMYGRTSAAAFSATGWSPGIANSNSTEEATWASELSYATNYRLVIGTDISTGVSDLWVDPTASSDTKISGTGSVTISEIGAIFLRQSSATPNLSYTLDNLVVSETFSDVITTATTPSGISEGFEGTFPPMGWTNTTITGHAWEQSSSYTNSGTYSAKYKGSTYSAYEGELITPRLNLTTSSVDSLVYYLKNDSWGGDQNECAIYVSTDLGTTWTLITTHNTDVSSFTRFAHNLEGYTQNDSVYIKFLGEDNYGWGVYLDDLTGPPKWVDPNPVANLSESSLDFGTVNTASSSSQTVVLTNSGGSVLTGTITSDATEFTVGTATISVAVGTSDTTTITYTPSAAGAQSGNIIFTHNGTSSPDTVAVSGTGTTSLLVEGFEDAIDDWTIRNLNGDTDAWVQYTYAYYAHSGSGSAKLYTDYNSSNDDWLISPQLTLPASGSYRLRFWTRAASSSEPDELKVMLSTSDTSAAAFTDTLMSSTPINFTTYAEYVIDLSAHAGSSVYIAFVRNEAPADGWNLYLDDVEVELIPPSPTLSLSIESVKLSPVTIGITSSSVAFYVGGNSGAGALVVDSITTSNSDYSVALTTMATGDTVIAGGTVDLDLSWTPTTFGLTSANVIMYHNASSSPDTISLSGEAGYQYVDFDDQTFPIGWTVVDNDTVNAYGYEDGWDTYSYNDIGYSGYYGYYARSHYNVDGSDDWMITNKLTPVSGDSVIFRNNSSNFGDVLDTLHVYVSTTDNEMASFTTEIGEVLSDGYNTKRSAFNLDSYAGSDIYVAIVHHGTAGTNYYSYRRVDDVLLPAKWINPVAEAILSTDTLDLGGAFANYAKTETFTVTNNGAPDLAITGFTSDNAAVTVSPATATLAYDSSETFTVTVTATAVSDTGSATLTIASNDAANPTLAVNWITAAYDLTEFSLSTGLNDTVTTGPYPDYVADDAHDTINVQDDTGLMASMMVFVDLDHTYMYGVDLTLTAPNGNSVVLFDGMGGYDGMYTVVLDGGSNTVAPFFPDAPTTNSLNDFVSGLSPDGNWVLQVHDSYSGYVGVLKGWGIKYIEGPSGFITGTVTNSETGVAIDSALVSSGGMTYTDAAGSYSLESLAGGSGVSVTKTGYNPAFFTVPVVEGDTTVQDVALMAMDLQIPYSTGFETGDDVGTSASNANFDFAVLDTMFNADGDTILPSSGTYMLAYPDSAGVNYNNNDFVVWTADSAYDISEYGALTLSLDAIYDTESNWDYFYVGLMLDDSSLYVSGASFVDGQRNGIINGSQTTWTTLEVDVSWAVGMSVTATPAIIFDSDASVNGYWGGAFDNIALVSNPFYLAPPGHVMANSYNSNIPVSWEAPAGDGRVSYNLQYFHIDDIADLHRPMVMGPNGEMVEVTKGPRQYETLTFDYDYTNSSTRSLVGYNIYRHNWPFGDGDELIGSSATNFYVDFGVADGGYYDYWVEAVYHEGTSPPSPNKASARAGTPYVMVVDSFGVADFDSTIGEHWEQFSSGTATWIAGDVSDAQNAFYPNVSSNYVDSLNNSADTNFALVSDGRSGDAMLISPFLDFTHHESAVLDLDAFALMYTSSEFSDYGSAKIKARADMGEWVEVLDLSYNHNDGWEHEMVDVSWLAGHDKVQFAFGYKEGVYTTYYGNGMAIDNVDIHTVPGLTSLTATGTAESVELAWSGGRAGRDNSNYIEFTVEEKMLAYERYLAGQNRHVDQDINTSSRQGGDTFADAVVIDALPYYNTGTTVGYANDYGPYDTTGVSGDLLCGWNGFYSATSTGGGNDVVYALTIEEDTTIVNVSLCGSGYDTALGVFNAADSTLVLGSDDFCGLQSEVQCALPPGTYYIVVDGYGVGSGTYTIDVHSIEAMPDLLYNVYKDGNMIAEGLADTVLTYTDNNVGLFESCYIVTTTMLELWSDAAPDTGHHFAYIESDYSNEACATMLNTPPSAFALITPTDGEELVITHDNIGSTQIFAWSQSVDPNGYPITYHATLQVPAGTDTLEISVDTTGTAVQVPYASIADVMAIYAATTGYYTADVSWTVYADDGSDELEASNGPRTITVDVGWYLGSNGEAAIPDVFALHQNYPNPFNPVTTIRYDVPEQAHVMMEIYNLLGQKVAVVVNGVHEPGFHAVRWNGTNIYGNALSSGMYFYHIQAGDFRSIKKLILVK